MKILFATLYQIVLSDCFFVYKDIDCVYWENTNAIRSSLVGTYDALTVKIQEYHIERREPICAYLSPPRSSTKYTDNFHSGSAVSGSEIKRENLVNASEEANNHQESGERASELKEMTPRVDISDEDIAACPFGLMAYECVTYISTCLEEHLQNTKKIFDMIKKQYNLLDISTSSWAIASACLAIVEKDFSISLENAKPESRDLSYNSVNHGTDFVEKLVKITDSMYKNLITRPWSFLDNSPLEADIVIWRSRFFAILVEITGSQFEGPASFNGHDAIQWTNVFSSSRQFSSSVLQRQIRPFLTASALLLELSVTSVHIKDLSRALTRDALFPDRGNRIRQHASSKTQTGLKQSDSTPIISVLTFSLIAAMRVSAWRYFAWGTSALYKKIGEEENRYLINGEILQEKDDRNPPIVVNQVPEFSSIHGNVTYPGAARGVLNAITDNDRSPFYNFTKLVTRYLNFRGYTSQDIVFYTYVHGLVTPGYDVIFLSLLRITDIKFFIFIVDDEDAFRACRSVSKTDFNELGDIFLCIKGSSVLFSQDLHFAYQDATVQGKLVPSLALLKMGVPHVWTDYDILFIENPSRYINDLRHGVNSKSPLSLLVTEHWESRSLNNGFFYIATDAIHWLEYYIKTLIQNPVSHDQNLFDALLRHSLHPYEPGVDQSPIVVYGLFNLTRIASAGGYHTAYFNKKEFLLRVINRRERRIHSIVSSEYECDPITNVVKCTDKDSGTIQYPLVYHLHGTATELKIKRMQNLAHISPTVDEMRAEGWKGSKTRRFLRTILSFVSNFVLESPSQTVLQPHMKYISISGVMSGDLLSHWDYSQIYGYSDHILKYLNHTLPE